MKVILLNLLKTVNFICVFLILFLIIKYSNRSIHIFPFFFAVIAGFRLLKEDFFEIFILIFSFVVGVFIFLFINSKSTSYPTLEKITIIVEMIWLFWAYIEMQKYEAKKQSYKMSLIEKKEDLESSISIIKKNIIKHEKEIYNLTAQIQNYKLLEEIINKLTSIVSTTNLKNYVIATLNKLYPNVQCKLYLDYLPEKGSFDYSIVDYAKKYNNFLYIPDLKLCDLDKNLGDLSYGSIICIPIKSQIKSSFLGYLILHSEDILTEDILRFVSILCYYISVAVTNIKLFEKTKELSITDSLTGLYLRRYLKEILSEEIRISRHYKKKLSLALIDIDNFKKINDTYGHTIGDEVLIRFSNILRSRLRETDVISRYGGDEFMVVFPNTSIDNAYKVCEGLKDIVCKEIIVVSRENITNKSVNFNPRINFTISCGVNYYKESYSLEEFIKKTDELLYAAKKLGKNRVVKCKQ